MQIRATRIADVKLIVPRIHRDARGLFLEAFHAARYREVAGVAAEFVQDNFSRSRRGVLRGMHFQRTRPQGKLIRVTRGAVFDVAVDIRPRSATFGRWVSSELSEQNRHQLWIPPGFAHGFLALSEEADVEYKCTEFYIRDDEGCLAWDDPDVGVDWPLEGAPVLSERDARGTSLASLAG